MRYKLWAEHVLIIRIIINRLFQCVLDLTCFIGILSWATFHARAGPYNGQISRSVDQVQVYVLSKKDTQPLVAHLVSLVLFQK